MAEWRCKGGKREERNEFKVKCVGFIFSRRRRSKESVRAKGRSGRLSGFQRVGMSAAGLAFPRLSGGYSSKQAQVRTVLSLVPFGLVYFRVENGSQQQSEYYYCVLSSVGKQRGRNGRVRVSFFILWISSFGAKKRRRRRIRTPLDSFLSKLPTKGR